MWVTVPAVVLLAIVAISNVNGDAEPLNISNFPADDQGRKNDEPVISLEYKPIKPSYLSSGSNVAQIVPPGQPWPASAAGYANFSQVKPNKLGNDVPVVQSSPTTSNIINLDMSNPNLNIAETLEKALASRLVNVKPSDKQQTIPLVLNITPPPNAKQDFVKTLQAAIKVALAKLVPTAGSSLGIAISQTSSGVIVNIKANLDVIIPAKKATPTLPPSTVPEIDLTKTSSGLLQDLQSILQVELSQAGYNANSKSVQKFTFSFSVLPPQGATKDYVKLYILGPLQAVLKQIAPGAALTSVSVNTQQSNQKILRQTVKCSVQIVPPTEVKTNSNLVEVPEVDLNAGGNVVNTVISTLQNQVMKNVAVNPSQAKTLSIPFKITPPVGATQQQIQDLYITPISQVLSTLDPTGKILKISRSTLSNGDIIITIYMNIPPNTTTATSSNAQIQPAVVSLVSKTPSTTKPVIKKEEIKNEVQTPVSIINRNGFPEGEEDEIPEISKETSESTESENVVPNNAIRTSVVDLTTPTASVKNVQQILDKELSPLSNPKNDGQPKVLAIPFRMKPPAGATSQEIEENVVAPIGKLLTTLEPTGNVITSETKPLPNGDVESVVYFNIPSVDNSKTYKVISDELKASETSTIVPAKIASTEASTTLKAIEEPVISPVAKVPQTEIPKVKVPNPLDNAVIVTPIDSKQPSTYNFTADIEQKINEVRKTNGNGQPQVIGFPFILSQPTPLLIHALKMKLAMTLPSGKILKVSEPKALPNGSTEVIIYDEIPAITNEKTTEKVIEETTKPTIEPTISKVLPETKKAETENEIPPKNALIVEPIDISQPNYATLPSEIERRVNNARKDSNGRSQVIGFPFILSGNHKPNFFLTHSLKIMLENFVPTGKIVQVGEPKLLPNGDTEFIMYDELSPVSNEPIAEKITQKPTVPSVVPIETNVISEIEQPQSSTVIPQSKQPQQKPPTPSVKPIAPKVLPKTEQPQEPENAIITSPIDLNEPNLANLPSDIQQSLKELKKNNNGQPQVVGLPFILPGNQKPNYFLTQSLKTVLKALEPSGNILQVGEPKTLPNGDTQFIIYDELPAITNEEPTEKQTKPIVKPTVSQVIPKNNEQQPTQTTPSIQPIAPKVVPKTEQPEEPENAIITSPIDLNEPNLANLPSDIEQTLKDLKKNNNGKPQVIGIPFTLPGNQKPNFFLTQALKTVLKALEPSGNILQVGEPKTLPNGDTQFIIYDELPAITNEEPSEKQTNPIVKPIVSQVIPENNEQQPTQTTPSVKPIAPKVVPKTEQPQEPENAIITSPIDLNQLNIANLPSDIEQTLEELKKNNNGQPQVIGIPFTLPGNQKPNFLLTQALKTVLKNIEPSGNILQVGEPKALPNGDTQFIIYDELPAVTNEKPTEEQIKPITKPTVSQMIPENNEQQQIQTTPSVEPIAPKVVPKTEQPQELENAIITSPIDLNQPNIANLPSDIEQTFKELKRNNNGQPQVIGIPFTLPGNQKPNFLLTQALKTVLKNLEPSGNILQVGEPKTLPNGNTQFIIYDELPAVTTKKPGVESIEEQTEPTTQPRVPKMISENKQPISQNEVEPENAIILESIDLKHPDYVHIPRDIRRRLDKIAGVRIGQPQIVGLPFILSRNQTPNYLLTQSLKTMLQTLEPSGNILQVTEPKVLPNGDTEFIIYDELPALKNKKDEKSSDNFVDKMAKSLQDVQKLTPHEPIIFPVEPSAKIPGEEKTTIDNVGENLPVAAVEDVNLDEDGVSLSGEVTEALTKATSALLSSNTTLNNPVKLKFDVYTPRYKSLSDKMKIINDVASELLKIEPNAKIVSAKTDEKSPSKAPDGSVEIVVPSIASSKIAQSLKNALRIPTIDINISKGKLADVIENLLQNSLKSIGQLNSEGSQIFNLNFRLNPYDTKGSVHEALKALKDVDPKGQIISHKIKSGPDGFDYLDLVYLIPKLENSKMVESNEPEIAYESFVNIDTKNPFNGLLENVVKEVGAAEDEIQGAKEGQLVDLPLDFKFTNSRGLSDSRVSEIISQTLPSIKGYISQILPDGKIVSVDTIGLPDSDDVILKIVVRTPYEPDDTIVIEEVKPRTRTVVTTTTTPKPKSRGLFGILGF